MKVVSFCLYGTAAHYRAGAVRNAELCRTFYPGWDVWFYVSATIPLAVNDQLRERGARVIVVPEAPDNAFFMTCRFLPCADPAVKIAIFRDTDSRIEGREAAAVAAWLESGKSLHIMRDHPWHPPRPEQYMILGGMWGVRCAMLRDVVELAERCTADVEYGADQRLLTRSVYPRFAASGDLCVHDDLFDRKPFPTGRTWISIEGETLPLFVGCQFGSDDRILHVEHLRVLRDHLAREEAAKPTEDAPPLVPPHLLLPATAPARGLIAFLCSRIQSARRAWFP
jgi:hypothetical protein